MKCYLLENQCNFISLKLKLKLKLNKIVFRTADEALHYGMINQVVSEEKLDEETLNLAEKITRYSSKIVELGKKAFYEQIEMDYDQAATFASAIMIENLKEKDCSEGIDAFINKRKPNW